MSQIQNAYRLARGRNASHRVLKERQLAKRVVATVITVETIVEAVAVVVTVETVASVQTSGLTSHGWLLSKGAEGVVGTKVRCPCHLRRKLLLVWVVHGVQKRHLLLLLHLLLHHLLLHELLLLKLLLLELLLLELEVRVVVESSGLLLEEAVVVVSIFVHRRECIKVVVVVVAVVLSAKVAAEEVVVVLLLISIDRPKKRSEVFTLIHVLT